jgi:hypothetical protein
LWCGHQYTLDGVNQHVHHHQSAKQKGAQSGRGFPHNVEDDGVELDKVDGKDGNAQQAGKVEQEAFHFLMRKVFCEMNHYNGQAMDKTQENECTCGELVTDLANSAPKLDVRKMEQRKTKNRTTRVLVN